MFTKVYHDVDDGNGLVYGCVRSCCTHELDVFVHWLVVTMKWERVCQGMGK